MGAKSLQGFLEGGPILGQSRSRLFRWLRQAGTLADLRGAACVRMLQEILCDLPEERQVEAARDVLTVLEAHFREAAGAVPDWLERGLARVHLLAGERIAEPRVGAGTAPGSGD